MRITKIRHASLVIESKAGVFYIDPYLDPLMKGSLPKADVVLISHPGYDHGTQQGVSMISTPQTKVLGPLSASDDIFLDVVSAGDVRKFDSSMVTVVAAKHAVEQVVAFALELDSQLIFYPGDSVLTEEMRSHQCTVLILPLLSGVSLDMRVDFVRALRPRLVIPTHYGLLSADAFDARALKERVEGEMPVKVAVLADGESIEL